MGHATDVGAIAAEFEKCRRKWGGESAPAALETLERLLGGAIPDAHAEPAFLDAVRRDFEAAAAHAPESAEAALAVLARILAV
jgi:hypothetical protein